MDKRLMATPEEPPPVFMGAHPWAIIKPREKSPAKPASKRILNRPKVKMEESQAGRWDWAMKLFDAYDVDHSEGILTF